MECFLTVPFPGRWEEMTDEGHHDFQGQTLLLWSQSFSHLPNPSSPYSHLFLAFQGPTVEENMQGVVGLDSHCL